MAWLFGTERYARISICGVTFAGLSPVAPLLHPQLLRSKQAGAMAWAGRRQRGPAQADVLEDRLRNWRLTSRSAGSEPAAVRAAPHFGTAYAVIGTWPG